MTTMDSVCNSEFEEPVIDQVDFAGKDVLEVGCGKGCFTQSNLMESKSVVCIDPDTAATDYLKEQLGLDSRFAFHTGDIVDFPLAKSTFDIAVFSHSL